MTMRRAVLILPFLALIPFASPAFGWGSATHAYIADHLGYRFGALNDAEIYGEMAADFLEGDPHLARDPTLSAYTHGAPGDESFMTLWQEARRPADRAAAYGWVAHNAVWGADSMGYDPVTSFVGQRAAALEDLLATAGVWDYINTQFGFYLPAEDRRWFCVVIVETDGDIVLKSDDPRLGERVMTAALVGDPNLGNFLARVLPGPDPDTIRALEDQFRHSMYVYGAGLAQKQDEAIELLSHQVALHTLMYFTLGHPELNVDEAVDTIDRLSHFAMLTELPYMDGYVPAVQETILAVSKELNAHHVVEGWPGPRGAGNR
jgi:hypothetical protein